MFYQGLKIFSPPGKSMIFFLFPLPKLCSKQKKMIKCPHLSLSSLVDPPMVVVSVSTRAKTSTTTEGISGWRRVASPRAVATASRLKTPFRPFWRSSYSALLTISGLDSVTTAQSQVLSKNKFVCLNYVSFKIKPYRTPKEPILSSSTITLFWKKQNFLK